MSAPPSQRCQCRYFNAERLVNWAIDLLNCPLSIFEELLPCINKNQLEQRLKEKLLWLNNYKEQISLWGKMIQMTRSLEKQLKIFGLNRQSLRQFSRTLSSMIIPQSLESFKQKILNYLQAEIELIEDDKPRLLATSDVIESIFGQYKYFSKRCPLKDIRSMLLTIPLLTMNLTTDVIKNALERVRGIDLSQWVNDVFGQSMFSKRKTFFAEANSNMKTATKITGLFS